VKKLAKIITKYPSYLGKCLPVLMALTVALTATYSNVASAQQVETSVPPSQRVTINLSAGMPGQNHWLYLKDHDATVNSTVAADDSNWTPVGIPHGANYLTTFINQTSGGGDGSMDGGSNWYRLHFTMGTQYANSKVMVEFEGAHTGAQVYINGTLLPGITAVTGSANASHVIGFVPFVVDLTPYLKTDGVTPNVLAVSVSRNSPWFVQPVFSGAFRFGQGEAGLFRPAKMIITNKVRIPVNVYSNQKTWGTYVATLSEVPSPNSTAKASSAVIQVQTNVLNETTTPQQVTLTTQIVDAVGNVVATAPPLTQTVPAMTPSTFPSGATPMFDQKITVNDPTLWYPNASTFGTPYMYRVYHIVSINGTVVDSTESPLGIRTITWDHNYPYFNGHPAYLSGGSGRYDYPGLGSSVPEDQQWRDLAQFAAAGGNIWRPGHSTSSDEFVEAADAYGIMIVQPSGDGENGFATPPADSVTYKKELHRDMIIRDRSHPSILAWESNNGTMTESIGIALLAINNTWDPINTRVAADRTPDPVNGYLLGCTLEGCEVGIKSQFPNNPAWGSEYWGTGTARGLAYDNELQFVAPFVDDWRKSQIAKAFGMAQWYYADTPGEVGLFAEYRQFQGTSQEVAYSNSVRSLGASMVDQNRFPKLLYYVYQAAWNPFSVKPVIHLAHHWNRGYQSSAPIQVSAFSNCPSVRLKINGVQQGAIQTPNSWQSDTSRNLTQTTTLIPFQTSWTVNWAAGTLTAECLDQFGTVVATDKQTTAGAASKIVLSVVPNLVKPNGTSFAVTANGSDAAYVIAQVQDANGNWVPTAANNVTFSVSGPATYMGGTQQLVQTGSDAYSTAPGHTLWNYHSPGDPELQFEGGMTKVALLSQFTTGTVTITATAPGLAAGTTSYTIQPVPSYLPLPVIPALIIQPESTAVTVGQAAIFSVTATGGTASLTFQWYKNGTAIAGATGASYTTPNTTTADNNASYTVTVTDALGNSTSTPAKLSVVAAAAVTISAQPQSQTGYAGQTLQLSVAATGSPTLKYQWLKNGAAISGATSASYTTPVLTTANNGDKMSVVVTNPVNSITSAAATLTVNAAVAPGITQQPVSQAVLANGPATFSVGVSGSGPFSYQWQLNGSNLPGANAATYDIFQVQSSNVGSYTVVVTNPAGSVTSAAATLTIAPPGTNLAINQPATASSAQGTELAANWVNDGNLTTRWASNAGIDPSWITIDLGSVKSFDNVILYWEAAYATKYQIQYSNDNTNWSLAYTNNAGLGGVENVAFPTVQGRYIRMNGLVRATAYGYSLYEMQVYNVPQCGGAAERYTVLDSTKVHDNFTGLTWQRAETTYTGANAQGAQYTQPIAQSFCTSQGMRLPTQAEALSISGVNLASCAFPLAWSTWTSTLQPTDANRAAFVTYAGQASWQLTGNYPGGVVCNSGTANLSSSSTSTQASSSASSVSSSILSGGTNLALNAPVVASSTESAVWDAMYAADGNSTTRWASLATDAQWIYVDLGSSKSFNRVVLNWESAFGKSYQIQTSNDAVTWSSIYSTTTGAGGKETLNISGTGRYVRMLGITRGTGYGYSLWDFEVYGGSGSSSASTVTSSSSSSSLSSARSSSASSVTATTNLALNAPAVSSTDEGATVAAIYAADGNSGTRWASQQTDAQWIYVDLKSAYNISKVVLNWEAAYGKAYQIQVSNDAVTWTQIYATSTGVGGKETLNVSGTGRYVRMFGITRGTGYGYSLWDFEVYGTPAGQTVNLALKKPAVSSTDEAAGVTAQFAVDGDSNTRWASQFLENQWIYVDLGSVQNISRVILSWENAYASAYKIQVSTNATTWTDIYSTTTGDGNIDDITVTGSGRYVRVLSVTRATGYGISLWDFNIW
jgi:beta-galactosidase